MKIEAVEFYEYRLTYAHGEYAMSKGRTATSQRSILVRVVTDEGIEGWGESATLAGTYLPAFAGNTRAALVELGPELIGADPRNIGEIWRRMNAVLLDQRNAKSAIDIACWDIFGKAVGLPVTDLIGGRQNDDFPLYEAVPLAEPDAMADFVARRGAAGIRRFQLKVGNDPLDDRDRVRAVARSADEDMLIIADANGGWSLQQATVAVRSMADLDIHLEQPCRSIEDCALIRAVTTLPMILDEPVVTMADLYRAKYQANAGALNIKLGRVGGITGAVTMRNVAHDLGLTYCIEDMWGGDVASAAVSHVAASSPAESLLHASFFNDWTNEHVAGYQPRSAGGRGAAPRDPGLGITVDRAALGRPTDCSRPA